MKKVKSILLFLFIAFAFSSLSYGQTIVQAATVTTSTSTQASSYYSTKTIQTLLNKFGYNLKVDGIFGKLTLNAVKDFQKNHGLKVDGIVGPKTYPVLVKGNATTSNTTSTTSSTSTSNTTTATTTPLSGDITVAAAASLTGSLNDIAAAFKAQNSGVKITFNYDSSGTLQKQIENGAPFDLFISADDSNVNALDAESLIVKSSKKNLLSNDVVLIVNKDYAGTIKSLDDLKNLGSASICVGASTVPVGKYTQQSLTNLGYWNDLKDKFVYGSSVKNVLTQVDNGNCVAGFVYTTDALTSTKSVINYTLPKSSHEQIIYSGAMIKNSSNQKVAQAFLDYLSKTQAQAVFKKYDFIILN